ncbi:alkaline phosphatase [Dyadobacter sandarakinus]|uniref:Alkaline phosphatase n=1 Tax=Dyadobacter sandarakinus TaxID=2747268 RepID=A0ABX7I1W4_9BACT|nr:alkaline phosphatase [Dyadobacter sandarakinus]QRQ99872.1 alkaline phosphatase [Dyadobacter sandarakinus]
MKKLLLLLLCASLSASAQSSLPYTTARAHSHNDYEQPVPFYTAYYQHFGSVEADVFAQDDSLYVSHETAGISDARTLSRLYLDPLAGLIRKNKGALYTGDKQELQLLIDLKTSAASTMPILVRELRRYEDILAPKGPVRIVLSGNTPSPAEFDNFPAYIFYDGRPEVAYTPAQLAHVGLISQAFSKYTRWNGKGVLTAPDKAAITGVITRVHALGKPVRFWATPDHVNAWKMLMNLGIDYINTDHVEELGAYLRARPQAEFTFSQPYATYKPAYRNNDVRTEVKHVILLIGDGMGLAQIYAGLTANRGQLNLAKFLNIGFSKTNASDSYITDSAAGGTAMATGKKTRNRAIGVDTNLVAVPNLPEKLKKHGIRSAVISAGSITDATPAAFYAHQPYREMEKEIAHDFLKSSVDILIGGGKSVFESEKMADSLRARSVKFSGQWDDLAKMKAPFVLLDDAKTVSVQKGRGEFLIPALQKAYQELHTGRPGSFIMAEGAQIDYGGHANVVSYVVSEMTDFDQAVGEAMRLADSDGKTLVIVTADHETGGLTLLDGDLQKGYVDGHFSTNDHTAIMVPVFAYGPHSLDFRGTYENTEIYEKILAILTRYSKK